MDIKLQHVILIQIRSIKGENSKMKLKPLITQGKSRDKPIKTQTKNSTQSLSKFINGRVVENRSQLEASDKSLL